MNQVLTIIFHYPSRQPKQSRNLPRLRCYHSQIKFHPRLANLSENQFQRKNPSIFEKSGDGNWITGWYEVGEGSSQSIDFAKVGGFLIFFFLRGLI